jgi:hypothetical protein
VHSTRLVGGRGFLVLLLAWALVGAGPGEAGAATGNKPLVGAIRWDGWQVGNTADPTHWVTAKLYSDWPSRRPIQGWYHSGPGIDTQAIVDREIDWAADRGLDYWSFVWYPENLNEPTGGLMTPYHAYQASSHRDRMKFSMIIQTFWVAGDGHESYWRTRYVPDFVAMFKDPKYVRVSGNRPLVYWFGANQLGQQPDGFGSSWREQLQYLRDQTRGQLDDTGTPLGDPIIIDVNHDTAAAAQYGLDGVSSYGPSGAYPPASSGCTDAKARGWGAQAAKDTANLGPYNGLLTVPSPTAVNDPRPRDSDPDYGYHSYGFWSQPPTYGQWESHFQSQYDWAMTNPARTTDPPVMLVYAWDELDEGGGGIVPTDQEQFKYLDGIKAVTSGRLPGEYSDTYNGDNCSIAFGGSGWIRYAPVAGAHDDDVQISWTAGDTATLQAQDATGFAVRFSRGPTRGKVDISVDGGAAVPVDLYSPGYDWWEYTSPALAKGTHTLRMTVRADRNPKSTQNQIPLDSVRVQVQRTVAWNFDRDAGGWSPDHQASASVSGGALHVTANGTDAQLYNPSFGSAQSLALPAAANRTIHVRLRNRTASNRAAFYFLTDADRTWDGTKYISLPITPNSDYTDYTVDMGSVPAWKGTIRRLRFDPGEPSVTGGTYDIDAIRTEGG